MTIKITENPYDFAKEVIKSILTSSQTLSGIDREFRRLNEDLEIYLTFQQTKHALTNFSTSYIIPS